MEQLATGKRQRDIADQFKATGITRTSISNLARTIDTKDLNEESLYWDYKHPKAVKDKKYIYLNVDDTFTSLRENKVKVETESPSSIIATDSPIIIPNVNDSNKDAKRRELLEKRAFYLITKVPVRNSSIPIIEYAEQLYKQLKIFYGDISDKKIVVCGDGATWIQELANCLSADYVLDKFNIISLIYKTFPHRRKNKTKIKNANKQKTNILHKGIYEKCYNFLDKGDSKSLILYLKALNEIEFLPGKLTKINELITYVENHKIGIDNYQKSYYIGSQTEAMISTWLSQLKVMVLKFIILKSLLIYLI